MGRGGGGGGRGGGGGGQSLTVSRGGLTLNIPFVPSRGLADPQLLSQQQIQALETLRAANVQQDRQIFRERRGLAADSPRRAQLDEQLSALSTQRLFIDQGTRRGLELRGDQVTS